MTSIQLLRQRNEVRTTMDQKQSLELVQTMLHSALSNLTFMRGLFPVKAFDERVYEMREDVLPYEDFAAGNMPTTRDNPATPNTTLRVLRRDRSRRVNTFLDWLQNGAFEEIKAGKLRAVQIFVHADPQRRNEILEAYTFTIQYKHGDRSFPIGLELDGTRQSAASVQSGNTALQTLLRGVNQLCAGLSDLPKKRLLSMELVYDNRRDVSKRLEGFIAGPDNDICFPRIDGWEQASRTLSLGSGFHNAVLSISHLRSLRDSMDSLPDTLKFVTKSSRYGAIDLSQPANTGRALSLASERGVALPKVPNFNSSLNRLAGAVGDVALTQSSQVPETTDALRDMMQPEHIMQGDTQSQNPVYMPPPGSVTATPTTRNGSPSKFTDVGTPATRGTFSLLPQTQQNIQKQAGVLKKEVSLLAKEVGSRTKSGQVILCQCGHAKLEGDMIQCSICDTWQHLHCYGYIGDEDPRIPESHYCYWCVLGGKGDKAKYEALQELAHKRRVMFRVNEHGMRTRTDLARDLSLQPDQASALHQFFKNSKYVVQSSMSHKPGFRATGKPLFIPVSEPAAHEAMFKTFFDPMTHVEDYYEETSPVTTTQAAAFHRRQINSRLSLLPTPATPHRGSAKKRVAETPNSNLDLPTPNAHFETPTLPARRQTQPRGVKRSLDLRGVETSAAKKIATPVTDSQYASLQTVSMIDAGGESSPYSVYERSARKSRR